MADVGVLNIRIKVDVKSGLEDLKKVEQFIKQLSEQSNLDLGQVIAKFGQLDTELEAVRNATQKMKDENRKLNESLGKTGDDVNKNKNAMKSFETIGVRSTKEIKEEIQLLEKSYQDLKASGVATTNDLARASAALESKVGKLNDEMKVTAPPKARSGVMAMGAALGGYAMAAQVAIGAVRNVVSGVQTLINEADNHDMSVGKLSQGLRNVNDYSKENRDRLLAQADALSFLNGVQSDEILHSQGMLTTFHLNSKAIETLTPRLIDMAGSFKKAGKEMDLQQIAVVMGKATTMGSGALSRYGVVLTDAQKKHFDLATGMEKVNLLAEILDQNFKGMGEATATSTAKMQVATNNLQVATGGAFQGIQDSIVNNLIPAMQGLTEWINKNGQIVVKTARIIGVVLGTLIEYIVRILMYPFEAIATGFNESKDALINLFQLFKSKFTDMSLILGAFGRALALVFKGDLEGAKKEISSIADGLVEGEKKQKEILDKMKSNEEKYREERKRLLKSTFVDPFSNALEDINAIIEGSPDVIESAGKLGSDVGEAVVQGTAEAIKEPSEAEIIQQAVLSHLAMLSGLSEEQIAAELQKADFAKKFQSALQQNIDMLEDTGTLAGVLLPAELEVKIDKEAKEKIETQLSELDQNIADAWKDTESAFADFMTEGIKGFKDLQRAGEQFIDSVLNNIISRVAGMLGGNIFSSLGRAIGIPGFATGTGGVFVDTPTLFIAGEGGMPEMVEFRGDQMRVTPQSRGGQVTIQQNVGIVAGDRNTMQEFQRTALTMAQRDVNFLTIGK